MASSVLWLLASRTVSEQWAPSPSISRCRRYSVASAQTGWDTKRPYVPFYKSESRAIQGDQQRERQRERSHPPPHIRLSLRKYNRQPCGGSVKTVWLLFWLPGLGERCPVAFWLFLRPRLGPTILEAGICGFVEIPMVEQPVMPACLSIMPSLPLSIICFGFFLKPCKN